MNEALRAGLQHLNTPLRKSARFRTKTVAFGRCPIGNLDDVAEVLAGAEGESFS